MTLDQFAEELHQAREKTGITLQQMALKTRIDIKFLEAIDKGDFSFLPEPYVKAFLKDYAKMVGLDENKVLQKYEAAKKGIEPEEPSAVSSATEEVKPQGEKRIHTYDATPPKPAEHSGSDATKRIFLNGLVILGAILLIYFLYRLFFESSNEIVVTEKPIEEIIEDQQRFEEPPQQVTNTASDSLSLTLLSSDTSWVQIVFDDITQEEFTLFPNSQKTIRAGNNFKITLGNSGAISFRLNNQSINYSGRKGAVAYVQINKDGLTYLPKSPAIK